MVVDIDDLKPLTRAEQQHRTTLDQQSFRLLDRQTVTRFGEAPISAVDAHHPVIPGSLRRAPLSRAGTCTPHARGPGCVQTWTSRNALSPKARRHDGGNPTTSRTSA